MIGSTRSDPIYRLGYFLQNDFSGRDLLVSAGNSERKQYVVHDFSLA